MPDSVEVGRADDRKDASRLAASQLILSSVHCAARNATVMFPDRMMVFDQVPIMLSAAECAAHRHLASSEHDEIARLSAELGFQVAASRRARELYVGLYAHRDTPYLTAGCRRPRRDYPVISIQKSRARLASPQPRPTSPVNGAGGNNRLSR